MVIHLNQTSKTLSKPTIDIAAFGWSHKHWLSSYYPDDLPEDWQLAYYSNEFDAVMVPSTYWLDSSIADCEQWLDEVHDDFSFYVQCSAAMFDALPAAKVFDQLKVLQPQLSALVFDGDERELHPDTKAQMIFLAESLDVELVGINLSSGGRALWLPDDSQTGAEPRAQQFSKIACIKNELNDLREVRAVFEVFISQISLYQPHAGVEIEGMQNSNESDKACIIVDHPQLQVINISRARSLLELMGY